MAAADTYGEALVRAMRRRSYTLEVTAHGVSRAGASAMTPKRLQTIIDGEPPVEYEVRALERVLRVPPPTAKQRAGIRALPLTSQALESRRTSPNVASTVAPTKPTMAATAPVVTSPPSPVLGVAAEGAVTLDGLAVWAAGEHGRRVSAKALELPPDRLRAARKEIGIAATAPTSPLDLIAASPLGKQGWETVRSWVPARSERPSAPAWSTFDRLDGPSVLRMLRMCGGQPDAGSEMVLLAVLQRALSERVVDRHDVASLVTRWVFEDPTRAERRVGRLAAVAVSLHDASDGSSAAALLPGTRVERAAATTWLAPMGELSPVQLRVARAVATLDHRAHDPGPLPFPLVLDTSLNRGIGQVVGLGHERRFVSEYVEVFEDRATGLTIALADDGEMASAWVALDGQGVFVAFDVEGATPVGLPEPGMAWAALMAMGWYLDLSVSDSRYYRAKRPARGIRRWEPADPWQRQHARTTSGSRVPPSAHYVRAHRRSYTDRLGSDEARARAPLAIRRLMLPTDTWVRGYFVGVAPRPAEVRRNLRNASTLADLLALEPIVPTN